MGTPANTPQGAGAADLAALARAYVLRCYGPLGRPVTVHVALDEGLGLIGVEVGLPPAAAAPEAGTPHACLLDVVALLARTDHRLTTTKILEGLEARGTAWGEATVKRVLAAAVRDELLNSDERAKPPGYGLPGWPVSH